MDVDNDNLLDKIRQYQKSIIKHSELGNDAKILYYIGRLYDMPITVAHLQETGIGRTINSLRKYSGTVGSASRAIVYKWKTMVANEEIEEAKREQEENAENAPPSSPEKEKSEYKNHSSDENPSKDSDKNGRSSKHESSDQRVSKSHHHKKDKKRDSHKSSHSKEDYRHSSSDRHRKDDKHRHDRKRKHEDDDSPSKKKKYEVNDSDTDESTRLLIQENSLDSAKSNEILVPNSTNVLEYHNEERFSPAAEIPSSSNSSSNKKHHKSDKHRSRDKESDKKHINGNSSSKKSSHRDKSSSSSKKDRSSSSKTESKEKIKDDSKKAKPEKVKKLLSANDGIDSGSGASFAEALGMIEPRSNKTTSSKKKMSSPIPSTSTSVAKFAKPSKSSTESPVKINPNLLAPNVKLEPLELNISQIPEITTNYKPLGVNYSFDSPLNSIKHMTEEEALSKVISSKTQRTKVYSGNKSNWGYVPSLFQLCVRVLQDNIDALEYTGGVPYNILKPVLERATAKQLLNTEYYNSYLIEESDELWEKHCKRECKGMQRQELESWRDMYLRCRDERDAKLKALTVNIKQSIDKSLPVRQTKLAYVDSVVKPPRAIARKQAKYGTDVMKKPIMTPTARLNSIASSSGPDRVAVPNPGARAASSSSASAIKPKKAPLMQKTLALIKSRFRR